MTRLRKQRRRKKFRYNINRKRLRSKINNVGKIGCTEVSNQWEKHKSIQTNLEEMGLSYNPNETIKIHNFCKKKIIPSRTEKLMTEWSVEEEEVILKTEVPVQKKLVADKLLEDAKAPRQKMFRLPGSIVEWVTYLMDKYGKDYRAMAKDKKNYDQETWKQIRRKIKLFKGIPEQYCEYLKKKGVTELDDYDSATSSDGEL